MIKFKQYIKEIFDKPPSEFSYTKRGNKHHYEFEHKGKPYTVTIHHESPTHAGVTFYHSERKKDSDNKKFKMTNDSPHDAHHVMNMVGHIMKHHASKPENKGLQWYSFTSDNKESGGRQSLYRRVTKKMGGTTLASKEHNMHYIPTNN
jgi:hypothetical protein